MADVVTEGWYVPKDSPKRGRRLPRWVLRVTESDVYYGKGGTSHFFCKLNTFQAWMRRTGAQRAQTGKRA